MPLGLSGRSIDSDQRVPACALQLKGDEVDRGVQPPYLGKLAHLLSALAVGVGGAVSMLTRVLVLGTCASTCPHLCPRPCARASLAAYQGVIDIDTTI